MAEKLTREVCEIEITKWLDKKKVFQETRDTYKQHIDILIEAMMNGVLVLTPEFEFVHTLLFPLGDNEDGEKALTYMPRINDKQLSQFMKGVKSDDADERLNGLLAALTRTTRQLIKSLDSVDKRISVAIGVFFM